MVKLHIGCTICLGISLVFVAGLSVSLYFVYERAWVGAHIHYKTGKCEIVGCNTSMTEGWEGRYYIYRHSTVITLKLIPDNLGFIPPTNITFERTIYDYYDMFYYGAYLASLCGQNTTTCYYQVEDIDNTLDAMSPDQYDEMEGQLAFAVVLFALVMALFACVIAGIFVFLKSDASYYFSPSRCC